MDIQTIESKVFAIAKEVFSCDGEVTRESTSKDIKAWDSMNQMRLIAEVEKAFSIKFKMKDLLKFASLGNIIDGVQEKLG